MFKDKKTVFGKAIACLLMSFVIVTSVPATIAADAATGSMPKMIDNTWNQLIKTTYMTATDSGYMRVVGDDNTNTICVEYYDNSFMMTSTKNIKKELSIWGGFYEGSDAYYIVVGKKNTNCVDNTEVIRIIKYDKSWNRLGAGSIRAKEGWDYEIRYPFDYGCVSMTESDGKLYVATGREGYVDPSVGQGHQGMMLIRMDETSFATEIVYGDFWHSFAQYLQSVGTNIYVYEQSEGSRCTSLARFDGTKTNTDYFDAFEPSEKFSVFDYGGSHTSVWSIPCMATVDDLAVSADNILGVGTSIDQSKYGEFTETYNIYLTVTPQSDFSAEATRKLWLTNYTGGQHYFAGVALTKVNDNRFLVTWEEYEDLELSDDSDLLSDHKLRYMFIDGSGNKLSGVYTRKAAFSDCHPIMKGKNAVYCASTEYNVNFYSINTDNGGMNTTIYNSIENAYVYGAGNKTYTGKPIKLNLELFIPARDLIKGTDYTVSYQNNTNVGTAKAVIRGKGVFGGTRTVTFKILPKATSINKLTAGKKSMTVKWAKQTKQVTGYEIQYSTSKKFTKSTTKTVKKASTTQKKISKLKSKKTYYVRVRTYKTVSGKKYYSKWSKVKKIKVK